MKSYDFEHAKAFFAAKTGFTTGVHEVDGMVRSTVRTAKTGT